MPDNAKPWEGEFPIDRPEDLDDEARRILLANIRAGSGRCPDCGEKYSETVHAYCASRERCAHCGEPGKATGHQDCQYPQDM